MMCDGHQSQPPTPPMGQPPAQPSILPEFVLLPGVFDKALLENDRPLQRTLSALLSFLCSSGLLASVPKDKLETEIRKMVGQLPGRFRNRFMEYLNRLRDLNRFIERPGAKTPPEDSQAWWMDKIIQSDNKLPFACITCGDAEICNMGSGDERFTTLDQLPDTKPWSDLGEKWQERVRHCYQDYDAALAPMLRFAKRVEIVDPFLDPRDSKTKAFLNLVSNLLHRKLEAQPSPQEVQVHTGLKPFESGTTPLETALTYWGELLPELHSKHKHKYKMFLWEKQPDGTPFHDRLILTNQQCGISSPQSFGILPREPFGDTNWTLLSTTNCRVERERYLDNAQTYKRLCDPLVFGKRKRTH